MPEIGTGVWDRCLSETESGAQPGHATQKEGRVQECLLGARRCTGALIYIISLHPFTSQTSIWSGIYRYVAG